MLRDIREEIQRELERRRAILHRSMRYSTKGPGQSTKDGPKPPLFTMDNKRFFDTRRDMNRYALHLRVEISKVIYFLNIRRCAILSEALGRWRAILQEAFLESDLKGGHILPYSDNEYRSNSGHGFDEMKYDTVMYAPVVGLLFSSPVSCFCCLQKHLARGDNCGNDDGGIS